jgi:hypothetical protein
VGHVLYRGTLTPNRTIELATREVHTEDERIQLSTEGWVADQRRAEDEARQRGVVYEFPLKCFHGFVDETGRRLLEERVVHDRDELARTIGEDWSTDRAQAVQSSYLRQLEYLDRQRREEQAAAREDLAADRRLRALQLEKLSRELEARPAAKAVPNASAATETLDTGQFSGPTKNRVAKEDVQQEAALEARRERRRGWIKEHCDDHDLNRVAFLDSFGYSDTTLYAIVNDDYERLGRSRKPRTKLLQMLGKSPEEWDRL